MPIIRALLGGGIGLVTAGPIGLCIGLGVGGAADAWAGAKEKEREEELAKDEAHCRYMVCLLNCLATMAKADTGFTLRKADYIKSVVLPRLGLAPGTPARQNAVITFNNALRRNDSGIADFKKLGKCLKRFPESSNAVYMLLYTLAKQDGELGVQSAEYLNLTSKYLRLYEYAPSESKVWAPLWHKISDCIRAVWDSPVVGFLWLPCTVISVMAVIAYFGMAQRRELDQRIARDPVLQDRIANGRERVKWHLQHPDKPMPSTEIVVTLGYAGMSQGEACSGAYSSYYKYPVDYIEGDDLTEYYKNPDRPGQPPKERHKKVEAKK